MTRTEHLLFIVAEECAEVAQRASKAARFGVGEIQPGQDKNNLKRLLYEFADLCGAMELLAQELGIPNPYNMDGIKAKKAKVEFFLDYSKKCDTLQES